ncbi:MAG TPA: 5'-nucleotidase C-terminal domain-containing protein [Bellilinea sp.]|nr:5'-nucleotidase C-terminal domain-containing protein [Bellilinea sp.]
MTKKFQVLLALILVLSLAISVVRPTGTAIAAETRNIVILGTADIHGNVDNYDYFTDSVPTGSSARGLAKIWTYAQGVALTNPNTILIDNGDTIQGNPLAYYFNMIDTSVMNPLAAVMNEMNFVSGTIGNHEFNYGPTVLNKYKAEAEYPLLSANVTGCRDYTFQPYVIEDVAGVQVGILGLTPPAVTHWERPENIVDCVFGDAMIAANHYVPIMRTEGADVIVVAAHTGLDETYGYGREENFAKFLANEVPGIDVILAGHAHANVASQVINGVLITEPNYHGRNISNIQITMSGGGTDWSVTAKSSTTPAVGSYAEDSAITAITQPYHNTTVTYINTPIGTATADFPGGFIARVQDGPMADLINQVQMDAAAEAGFPVEASLAALFTNQAQLAAGPIKLKDAYAAYIYDNTLYVIEATGQQIKDELEWTAEYFNQYFYEPGGVTVNSAVRDYNYDLWSGVEYRLDVTKPVGHRVVELKLNGEYLAMDQVVRVALNNYRATGKFPTAPKLYQSTVEVRELITDWIMERGTISPEDVFVQNFTLMPPVNTWLSTTAGDSVVRSDYAELLWTAFEGSAHDYMDVPRFKTKTGARLTRQEAFFLLGDVAMGDLWDFACDPSILKAYTDLNRLLGWAKDATACLIEAGVFTPVDNKLLPEKIVTNAEALAWVREARFPLFTFLSTNDFHGQLETGKLVSSKLVGGAAYNMTYINNYKALNPLGTSLFDAGDIMQGTPISNLLFGESVIDVYNAMGYQAAVVGNHEFDWGKVRLQERMAQADFPILLGNVFMEGTDTRPDWLVPTVMFDIKGQQVGVIGVTSQYTPSIVMAGSTTGLEFREPAPVVVELAENLRDAGADIIVLLAHMPDIYGGVVSGEMATMGLEGIDLILSGHSHSGWTGKINGVPTIQQYSSGTAIGVSDLQYDRMYDSIASSKLQVVTTYNDGITPDAEIAAIVGDYQAEIAPIVNAVKASTLGIITRGGNDRYIKEVPMGDLIADAQRWKAGTQIAFMNPGGIRADISYSTYPHDITYGDFFIVQPFDNKLATLDLTGSQLYALLEQQFPPAQTSVKLLQVSGIKYSFNLALPVGSRITSLTLTDGTPILPDATPYSVACNEFIATGGDGFSTFLGGTNVTRIGVSDLDALIDFVQFKYGTPPANTPIDPAVYPKAEGRITNVTP